MIAIQKIQVTPEGEYWHLLPDENNKSDRLFISLNDIFTNKDCDVCVYNLCYYKKLMPMMYAPTLDELLIMSKHSYPEEFI